MTRYVACIGGYDADADTRALARAVGKGLAEGGAIVVTGGRRGVSEAACRGAKEAGGIAIGILPGRTRAEANEWVTVAIPTGLGETRNALVVLDADAVVMFPGSFGTLSEAAFALLDQTLVIGLPGAWDLPGVVRAADTAEAVRLALG